MRLYSPRLSVLRGDFQLCGSSPCGSTCGRHDFPIESFSSSLDGFGLVRSLKKGEVIYCTPRCHFTRSWEVGLCRDHMIYYLTGSHKLTSRDFHVLQTFEVISSFLHAVEIQVQSGPRFKLYGSFCHFRPKWLKKQIVKLQIKTINPCVASLMQLLLDLLAYLYAETCTIDVSLLVDRFDTIQDEYFMDLHLDPHHAASSQRRSFTRLLGHLHGVVLRRIGDMDLVLRRYCRFGSCEIQVRLYLLLYDLPIVFFRRLLCIPSDELFHSTLLYRWRLVWNLKYIILRVVAVISVN